MFLASCLIYDVTKRKYKQSTNTVIVWLSVYITIPYFGERRALHVHIYIFVLYVICVTKTVFVEMVFGCRTDRTDDKPLSIPPSNGLGVARKAKYRRPAR